MGDWPPVRPYNRAVVETYRSIGLEMSWTLGAALILGTGVSLLFRFFRDRKLSINVTDWVVSGIGLLFALLPIPIPTTVAFPLLLLVLVGPFLVQTKKDPRFPKWYRTGTAVFMVVGAIGLFFFLLANFDSSVTLRGDSVQFTEFGEMRTVAREGLEVHATGSPRDWYSNRAWWSWTSYAAGDQLGPHVMGSEMYWGPDGMIRGDELGRRLAKWAGTEPKYRFYERD
jgi:hypothetical protein